MRLGPWVANSLEAALRAEVEATLRPSTPPRLRAAIEHALFPGGARLRPTLCLLVAKTCGNGSVSSQALAAACAIEMVHGASLVHDDLPCFDDADRRRGRPSVHAEFGEPTALLVGDALLVAAFGVLGRNGNAAAIATLAEASGAGCGIIAGQAWELESSAPLEEYHRAKTASLFEAAAAMGAHASGASELPWRTFGALLGLAFQAADDVGDVGRVDLGKSKGKDAALGRPSVVRSQGIEGARARVDVLLKQTLAALPRETDTTELESWLRDLAEELRRR